MAAVARPISGVFVFGILLFNAPVASAQQPVRLLNAACTAGTEQVTEPKTGRTFLLDYPCDLKAGEKVTFILSLHGGGSSGTWQRRYFPAFEQKEKYRLVVAAPYSPTRRWSEQDDAYRDEVLPPSVRARVSVEAGVTFGWERWVGEEGISIGVDRFGASAPGPRVFEELGVTADAVADAVRRLG